MIKKPLQPEAGKPVSLRTLAEYLDLSPATISLVVNNAPGAKSISTPTRERVLEAARKFNYQPNSIARSLRTRQSYTVGVIVPEFSEGYFTMVIRGVEEHLMQSGYLNFVVSHQGRADLIVEYPRLLSNRSVDGFILVNSTMTTEVTAPVVTIAGHKPLPNVANITLDHDKSVTLGLQHLYGLGHRRIVFMRGPLHVPDAQQRWEAILRLAGQVGITVYPELCIYLEDNLWSPELGYMAVRDLLTETRDFTAIFCFNDMAAIGTIRALKDADLSCPADVSVLGFDDILSAVYLTPSLTTVRQPMRDMGKTAADLLLKRIQSPREPYPETVVFEPELIVRESTGQVPSIGGSRR